MWALGQTSWQRAGKARHQVFCLLLLMERWWDGIFSTLDAKCMWTEWVFCLPLALMEMETSHYGDKELVIVCVEGVHFFLVGGSCFLSQLRLLAFCGRSWKDVVFHTFHYSGNDVLLGIFFVFLFLIIE
jgi:hypothetical protein